MKTLLLNHALAQGLMLAAASSLLAQAAAPRSAAQEATEFKFTFPKIEKFGKVIRLPYAAQQPRAGSRLCVDVTGGGEPDKLNPALEKAARFVNIYAGAGSSPASVQMAIVLHGEATLVALNDAAYAERFKTPANPNRECLQALREAGVQIYVCGQSLISKKAEPSQVEKEILVAVSALTSLVNLQADGYAYVPLN